MTEVNNSVRSFLLVNVLKVSGHEGMNDKMLTNNLCGLDVPLNDRFCQFEGVGVGCSGTMKRSVSVSSLVE